MTPDVRTLLAATARTASIDSDDQDNPGYRGVVVTIDATAKTATPSVVFTLEGKDPVSGTYSTLLASAAVTDVGTTVLKMFPGATAADNEVANDQLPAVWRVSATAGDTDSLTYSVGATLLP